MRMLSKRRHPQGAEMIDLLDGIISNARRGWIQKHLDRCEECRQELGMRQDARKGLSDIARLRARLGG
jgi:anti-sigma factor RsiW